MMVFEDLNACLVGFLVWLCEELIGAIRHDARIHNTAIRGDRIRTRFSRRRGEFCLLSSISRDRRDFNDRPAKISRGCELFSRSRCSHTH